MTQGINTLIIETVEFCNLKCKMCPTNNYTTGKSLMSDSVFEKILDIIKRKDYDIKFIDMTGWGEPLLDPKLEERIIEIKQTKYSIFIGFSTNGTLFYEKRTAQILKTGINHICISFDAGSKETYEKIRINSNYEKVIENLKFLSSLRDKEKTKLSAVSVIMKENFHEMDKFVELFYKLGFDFVTFKPLDVLSSKEILNLVMEKGLIWKKFLNLKGKYRNRIMINEWDLSINEIKNDCLARAASGAIFINCMGDVSPCCNLGHHVPNLRNIFLFNYEKKDNFFSFGNILSENFEEIIGSEIYKNFINAFKNSHLPEPCKGCRLVSKKLSKRVRKI